MTNVAIGFPTSGMVTAQFTAALAGVLLAETRFYKVKKVIYRAGCYVHSNRNQIVKTFLDSDCEWLLQLDPDLTFPYDLIQRLLVMGRNMGGKVVAGWYNNLVEVTNGQKQFIPLVFEHVKESLYKPLMPQGDKPMSVDAVATGCLMVHREVFEKTRQKTPSPWFDFGVSGHGTLIGEDIFFSKLVRDAGYEIWVDPEMKLEHYKMRQT